MPLPAPLASALWPSTRGRTAFRGVLRVSVSLSLIQTLIQSCSKDFSSTAFTPGPGLSTRDIGMNRRTKSCSTGASREKLTGQSHKHLKGKTTQRGESIKPAAWASSRGLEGIDEALPQRGVGGPLGTGGRKGRCVPRGQEDQGWTEPEGRRGPWSGGSITCTGTSCSDPPI